MSELNLEASNEHKTDNNGVNIERCKTKFDLWERKLLDLSTRNSLLNLRIKGSSIPLFVPKCSNIEDEIAQDKSFQIKSRGSEDETEEEQEEALPEAETSETAESAESASETESAKTPEDEKTTSEEIPDAIKPAEVRETSETENPENTEASETPAAVEDTPSAEQPVKETAEKKTAKTSKKAKPIPAKDYSLEDLADISGFREYIEKNCEKGVLFSSLTDAVLDKNIKTLYRGAKTSMEENGANTLFLACGFLKWYEKDRKEPCYAPILLIPVEIVKKLGIKYTMRRRDEDVQFNVTISEKLRQDFKIDFDSFSKELPSDENGVNVEAVFSRVREAVSPLKGWDVIESCVLGLFSFSQFVMWNDMHSHRDSISQNKIVKSLINGQLEWQYENISEPDKDLEKDVYLPIVADASQLAAIKRAGEGSSFVLHGPPGTGKSQTITSIIANCLANNKKVLFAAEKKAALDVVYKRLEKIGIAPFCLELHSNKVRKSYVLDQLRTASEVRLNSKNDGDYDKALSEIEAKKKELDKYVDELHIKRGCGMSLYELINVYASNKDAVDCGGFDDGFINEISEARIREIETSLGELVASSGNLEGKLPFVKSTEYTQDAKSKAAPLTEAFIRAYDEFVSSIEAFENLLAANNCRITGEPQTAGRIAGLKACAELITNLKNLGLPKGFLCAEDTEGAYLAVSDMIASCDKSLQKANALRANWKEEFLSLDGAALLNELQTARSRNAFVRGKAVNNVYGKVSAYDLHLSRRDSMEDDFKLLAEYKNDQASAMPFILAARTYLGDLYNPAGAFPGFDISSVRELNSKAHEALSGFASFDPAGSLRKLIGMADPVLDNAVNSFLAKAAACENAYNELRSAYGFEYGCFEPSGELFEVKKQNAEALRDDIDFLRDRMQFNLMASRCLGYKISNLVTAYGEGKVDGKGIISSFRKGYSSMMISMIIDNAEVLRTFSGLVFEQKISELSKLNDEFEKITRQEIYLRIAKNLPDLSKDANVSSALGILQHAIKSSGRGVSIRTLFTQIGELILKLCPCVLMSPLSCAQFLDPEKCGMFDIVVFDEASQLPTCKAIGVIARGKEAVVVGDPKQMPPTSFFLEQVDDGDDNFETDDLESILDDCLAVSMPQMFLAWHYRSRHESLITFSNKAFYEGRLYTFPSPDDRQSKVTMVDCGGTFDSGKTRTNKVEAQAVVEEIINRAHDPELSKYSVGVVTFNIQQQTLIEDLLDEAASKDPVLEKWAYGSEEPAFIKNLENVQGDERDVILFSVGYGKDETGKFIMNFGPLNRDGGWRRLNVAVTRSRIEMKVFSSISPEEIKITDTSSEGVKAFKRFLQYASGSTVWDQDIASTGSSSDSSGTPIIDKNAAFTGIADDICARFKAIGYDTDKGVGKSGFKIDIGVLSPEKAGAYCLGILLDGPVYASSGTTTSREVSQMSMLKGFGWNVVRVWSLEWWENPDNVFNKLVEIIKASEKPEQEESQTDENQAEVSEETSEENSAAEEIQSDAAEGSEVEPASEPGRSDPEVIIYGETPEENEEEAPAEAVEETDGSEGAEDDQAQKKTADVEDAGTAGASPEITYISSNIKPKEMTAAEFCDARNTKYLQENVMKIVDQESPVSSDVLAKKLITLAGISKMTPKLRDRCAYLIKSIEKSARLQYTNQKLDPASDEDDSEVIFLWKDGIQIGKVMDYYRVPVSGEKARRAADIPVQEAACAADYLARSQYGMPYESLIVETCKALGLSRAPVDSDNYKLGKRAVDYCIRQELLLLDDDGFVKGVD
ncbi:MAG: DUF3320 domain-containing protein [Saccharofermentans sp.]|nr:DUF3320 domain-containing protein [Saccharofermentans sp.]